MNSTPPPIRVEPRLDILNAMAHVAGAPVHMSVMTVAERVGKHAATVDQMLHALKADRLVDYAVEDNRRMWWRTEVPIPETFTSTASHEPGDDLFNDAELCAALGIPDHPPTTPPGAKLVTFPK